MLALSGGGVFKRSVRDTGTCAFIRTSGELERSTRDEDVPVPRCSLTNDNLVRFKCLPSPHPCWEGYWRYVRLVASIADPLKSGILSHVDIMV